MVQSTRYTDGRMYVARTTDADGAADTLDAGASSGDSVTGSAKPAAQSENPWAFLSSTAVASADPSIAAKGNSAAVNEKTVADFKIFTWIDGVRRAIKKRIEMRSEGAKAIDLQSNVGEAIAGMSAKTSQRIYEHFSTFSRGIMEVDFVAAQSQEEHFFTRNVGIVRYAALIVLICDCFWIAVNGLTNNSLNLDAPTARVGLIAQVALSFYMVLFSFLYKKRKGLFIRLSFLLFIAAIIFGVAGITDAKDLLRLQYNDMSQYGQIGFCSFLLVVVAILPLPSKFDSGLVIFMVVCGFVLPLLSSGAAAYPVNQAAFLSLLVIVTYLIIWFDRHRNAKKDIDNVQLVERLARASYIDALTHTFNRQAFDLALKHKCEDEHMVSIGFMMFDLDDFKHYNDYCSHSMGDDALRNVCEAIEDALDQLDEKHPFLYRYGGEEFVLMMTNPTPFRLMTTGVKIKNAVWNARLIRNDESEYPRLTITVGCAIEQIEDLRQPDYDAIHNADVQLYIGKRAKKNCVVIHDDVYR